MMEAIEIIVLLSLGVLVELEHRKAERRRRGDRALSAAVEFLAHSDSEPSPDRR
jgi:hypothetical protein